MSDERNELERLGTMLSPPDDSFDRLVSRRDRRRHGRQITAGVLALSLTALGVFGAYQLGRGTAQPSDGGEGTTLAASATIDCAPSGVVVTPAEIRPQGDGVHLEVRNSDTEPLMFEVSSEANGSFLETVEPGTTTPFTSAELYPGSFTVKCYDDTETDPATRSGAALKVTDQDGVFKDVTVVCPDGEVSSAVLDYPPGIAGEEGTQEEIARRHLGDYVQDGDVVETAGYPNALSKPVRVVRDGTVVASVLMFSVIEGGYIVHQINQCGEPAGPTG